MSTTIEVHDSIGPIADEWKDLSVRVEAPPFVRPGWVSAWCDAFDASGLTVFATRRDGRLTGALPVRRRRGTVVSPTNWHTPLFGPVVEDEESKFGLYEALFADSPRRVDLAFLPGETGDIECLNEAEGQYQTERRVISRSPYLSLDQGWDAYWNSVSRKLRSNVRRCRRRLEEQGELTVELWDGERGLQELLDEAFQIEASGWKGERGTAIHSSPDTRAFYEGVARWAAEQGFLRFTSMRLDGRPLAFDFALEVDRRHYGLKLGHDPEFDRLSPGTLLIAEVIERSFARGLESFEFLGDGDPHKFRWTQDYRELVRVQSFAPSASGSIERLIHGWGRRAAKKLLRRPA
jgi:CelD/BcsL family acetyltransferase involved in cellulose biosynthesis